jgi:hypothetical protein
VYIKLAAIGEQESRRKMAAFFAENPSENADENADGSEKVRK